MTQRSFGAELSGVFGDMKVVGFNTKEGLHLGVVESEEVIDLQAVDASAPNDLGEWLRRDNGDLTSLKALAQRARSNARRPLGGLDYTLPVARPGKIICLGCNYRDPPQEPFHGDRAASAPTIL